MATFLVSSVDGLSPCAARARLARLSHRKRVLDAAICALEEYLTLTTPAHPQAGATGYADVVTFPRALAPAFSIKLGAGRSPEALAPVALSDVGEHRLPAKGVKCC